MDDEQDLIDILQAAGLSDEEIDEIMGLSGVYEEQNLLEGDMGRAQERAGTAGPRGRGWGDVYVAANPLEHLAGGAQRVLGEIQQHRTGKRQRELIEDATQRRGTMLRGYMRGR